MPVGSEHFRPKPCSHAAEYKSNIVAPHPATNERRSIAALVEWQGSHQRRMEIEQKRHDAAGVQSHHVASSCLQASVKMRAIQGITWEVRRMTDSVINQMIQVNVSSPDPHSHWGHSAV